MYTLIGGLKSRAVRVAWVLEELGLEYDLQPEAPRSEEVYKLNPLGKIPVLLDDDHVITDSAAMMMYLADKHGGCTFAPGTPERAVQDAHFFFIIDELDAVLWAGSKHKFGLPEELRVPELIPSLKEEFKLSVLRLKDRLGDGPYLMGDTFTIADILAVHCLTWGMGYKYEFDEDMLAWAKGLRRREAFQRAIARQ